MIHNFREGNVVQHVKTGGHYRIIGYATLEKTLEGHVVYQSLQDVLMWLRPMREMFDGRFVKISDSLEAYNVSTNVLVEAPPICKTNEEK